MRYLFIVLILASCSPAAKIRRAEKLIKRAEELGARWHVDSVVTEIEMPVPQIQTDTIVHIKRGDTVVIEKDRLKVVIRRVARDTIMVSAECQADTIRTKVTKTITKTIKAPGYSLWQMIILALVFLFVGYGVRSFMRR
jgi:hypothetical protein